MTADELMAELDSAIPDERPVVATVQYVDESVTYNVVEVERHEDAIVLRLLSR